MASVLVGSGLGQVDLAEADEPLRAANGTIWVTNRTGTLGSVSVLDAGTGAMFGTVTVGSKPTGVVATADKVYVSNGSPSNSISVISKQTLSVITTIPTGAGTDPHHIMRNRNGRSIFVALFGTNTVAVLDTATDQVVDTLVTSANPTAKTHAMWVGNDGKTLYATNSLGSGATSPAGSVTATNIATGALLWEVEVGRNPSEVLVTNDERTAYVTARTENAVKVLDLTVTPPVVSTTVAIGSQPDTLQLTNDNKTLVVALRGSAAATLMDTTTFTTQSIPVEGTTTGHHWLSANGRYTFLAVVGTSGRSGIAVLDNVMADVVHTYLLPGTADPHGVFYEPARR